MTTEFSEHFCAAFPSVFGQAMFIGVEYRFEVLFSLYVSER